MQSAGVRGVILRGDYHCSHLVTVRADIWPDDVHLPDLEGRYLRSPGRRYQAGFLRGF
jgi:hypothetical protein